MPTITKLAAGVVAASLSIGLLAAAPLAAQDDPAPRESPAPGDGVAGRAERIEAFAAALGTSVDELRVAAAAAREEVQAQFGERPECGWDADTRVAIKDAFEEALAAQLGIGMDELVAAERTVLADALGDAVSSGRITQERADGILAAFDSGNLRAYLHDWIGSRLPSRLEQAVANGVLTQEQADQISEAFEAGTLRQLVCEWRQSGDSPLPDGMFGRFRPLRAILGRLGVV
jgi:hypothetical protein